MKKTFIVSALLCLTVSILNAQELSPSVTFEEKPVSFSMHICSDGVNYYTVNGGIAEKGKITSYSPEGKLIKSYPLPLDMRSIMYNKKTKSFYVTTADRQIIRIIDFGAGTYEPVYSDLYENKQSSPAFDPKGKFLYAFDNGTLSKYKFKKGTLVQTLSGLKCGDGNRKGAATVAVDKEFIYTWDSDSRQVNAYDKKGMLKRSFVLSKGDFGYSLSYANGMLFVSHSLQGKTGHWYGYTLWEP